MSQIKSFTDLSAWKEAHKLVLAIYEATRRFPNEEKFGLVNQLRRAVVSISSNIAEGFSRNTNKEKVQFYYTALGSLTEVHNQSIIAKDVAYIDTRQFDKLMQQIITVNKLLNGLIKNTKNISKLL